MLILLRDVDFQTSTVRSGSQSVPNRAPVIVEAPRSITARVNEPASIRVRAVDPDGDRLTYYWDFQHLETMLKRQTATLFSQLQEGSTSRLSLQMK